jgi:hypothetical protein
MIQEALRRIRELEGRVVELEAQIKTVKAVSDKPAPARASRRASSRSGERAATG